MKTLLELQVGDHVEYLQSGKHSLGTESVIIKITVKQIHIRFKNKDAKANGEIKKFWKETGEEIKSGDRYRDQIKPA